MTRRLQLQAEEQTEQRVGEQIQEQGEGRQLRPRRTAIVKEYRCTVTKVIPSYVTYIDANPK
jgi:hypothetical protein